MKVDYQCKELPDKYQRIFKTGKIPNNQGFEYYHTQTAYILMGILSVFPVLPLIYVVFGMIYSGLEFVYQKPYKFIAPFQEEIGFALLLVVVILVCIIMICFVLYGCFYVYMIFIQDLRISRAKRQNKFYYGLLLDKTHLLWRKKNILEPIFMIPKKNIDAINTYYKRGERGQRIKYFALEYDTPEGKFHIKIPSGEFQMKNKDSDEVIQKWLNANS